MKSCYSCRKTKPFSEFNLDITRTKDGYSYLCRDCEKNKKRIRRTRLTDAYDPENRDKEKWCSSCRTVLGQDQFSFSKGKPGGLNHYCKICNNLRRYKRLGIIISKDDFLDFLKNQNRCCAICKDPFKEGPRSIHIDHCHDTNTIRGLLCPHCNSALGLVKEKKETLMAMMEYLDANILPVVK